MERNTPPPAAAAAPAAAEAAPARRPRAPHLLVAALFALAVALLPLRITQVRAASILLPHQTTRQTASLTCEAASLQIALTTRGIQVSQDWINAQIPDDLRAAVVSSGSVTQWGDPYTAFVGNPNGSEPNFTGYGVYYPPVAAAAARAGSPSVAGEGWDVGALFDEVLRGHAAVVWTVAHGGAPAPRYWRAWDGRTVRYAVGEHAEALVGVDMTAQTVVLANPLTGQDDTMGFGQFQATFAVFDNMAVVIGGGGGVGIKASPSGHGYWIAGIDGSVRSFGDAVAAGSRAGQHLNSSLVGMASTPDGRGYWLVAADGGIFTYGDAAGYGSTGGIHLNQPIAGMARTASGRGYWLVAADGGIFPFGDAREHSYGSTGGIHLNQPVVGMAATASGNGYWLVAADGGIFPFGDAREHSYGSTGGTHLNQPVVAMTSTATGDGYWLVAADGGIFPFGDALRHTFGSTGGRHLNQPIVAMASTPDDGGYWLLARDGGIFPFGDAPGLGSTA